MRLDKFLKVSQLIKRRSVAKEAADGNKIKVNDKDAKPSTTINEGDLIQISYSTKKLIVRVLSVNEYTAKRDASSMYEVISNE